jgi:probable F420-dependent oxidoreductase
VKVRFAVSPGATPFDPDGLTAFATEAETLGFDTIWLSDVPLAPIGDPLVSLAFLAARTTRLKLGTNLVPIGRNPMLLARQLAQLDQCSEGRLLLSFVPGLDDPGERRALGAPTGDRGVMLEETIGLLRRWWAGERVDYREGALDFEAISVEPAPRQQPLEIWLGGAGPKAVDRVARCADGWLTAGMTPAEVDVARERIVTLADDLGHFIDHEHFGISIPFARTTVPEAGVARIRKRRPAGDLEDIVPIGGPALTELVKRHIESGLSKFVLRPLEPAAPDDLVWLADSVLPLQT